MKKIESLFVKIMLAGAIVVAGVYLYFEPFPYELGQEIVVSIDFDDLEPTT